MKDQVNNIFIYFSREPHSLQMGGQVFRVSMFTLYELTDKNVIIKTNEININQN